MRWAKTAENSTDYSVMNTARQVLWLPTSREEKYKAKQALDTFFVRTGDVLSAPLVFAGTHWLILGVSGFALTKPGPDPRLACRGRPAAKGVPRPHTFLTRRLGGSCSRS